MRTKQRSIVIEYVVLAFGITWGLVAAYLLLRWLTGGWIGELVYRHPVFWISGYSSLFAAAVVIIRSIDGDEIGAWLQSRFSFKNIGVAMSCLIVIPCLSIILTVILDVPMTQESGWRILLNSVLVLLVFAVPAVEIGWRGVMFSMVKQTTHASTASLINGGLAVIWQLPLWLTMTFISDAAFGAFDLTAMVLLTFGIALLNGWLEISQNGSLVYGMLLSWSTLIAIFGLGIAPILVAGITLLGAMVIVMTQGVSLEGESDSEVEPDEGAPDSLQQPVVERLGTVFTFIVIGVGVLLAIILLWLGRGASEAIIALPVPKGFVALLEYAGRVVVLLAGALALLATSIALIIAGIIRLTSRAIGNTLLLRQRVRLLEQQVVRLQGGQPEGAEKVDGAV